MLLRFVEALLLHAKSEEQARAIGGVLQRYTTLLTERPADALAQLQRAVWPAIEGTSYTRLAHYAGLLAALMQVITECVSLGLP